MENLEMAKTFNKKYAEKIGEIIQTIRVQKGMSQKEVSEQSLCREYTFNRIEKGELMPNLGQLISIASALNIKIKIGDREI